jgi:hypothetical protein
MTQHAIKHTLPLTHSRSTNPAYKEAKKRSTTTRRSTLNLLTSGHTAKTTSRSATTVDVLCHQSTQRESHAQLSASGFIAITYAGAFSANINKSQLSARTQGPIAALRKGVYHRASIIIESPQLQVTGRVQVMRA